MKNRINLDLDRCDDSAAVFKALSSPVRLRMLKALSASASGMNISSVAENFSLPLSTAALHVKVLEEAGLIFTEEKPGLRGAQKICAILAEDVYLGFYRREREDAHVRELPAFRMPVGNYFDCSVTKPCGIAGRHGYVGTEDSVYAFYSPHRSRGQLIWFTQGFLEYRFSNEHLKNGKLRELEFSFEACSEAPGYNEEWPSDITVWINGRDVFTFRSPGDYGGTRGVYTPEWWPVTCTQYGDLHRLLINGEGCFGDGRKTSDQTLESLAAAGGNFISFRIGVKEDAEYIGGINLFGENFGNYKQGIEMRARLER